MKKVSEMVSTHKKKKQPKRQLSQPYKTLKDFVIGNSVNVNVSEKDILEQETSGQAIDLERVNDNVCQIQVVENEIGNQITGAVMSAVMTLENRSHDTIVTATEILVIPRVELAVKLITGSTGHGTNSEVQNPDRTDFVGNFRNAPLMSASSPLDLDNEVNTNDEIRNDVDFEDGDFTALKHIYTGESMFVTW